MILNRSIVTSLLSVATLVAIWAALAAAIQSRYLPSPLEVAEAWQQEFSSGALWYHIRATLLRVAGAFVVAMLVGSAIGIWLGRRSGVNQFFDPWLIFALNIPALVTIVFCYLWIGLTEAAAIAAVSINKIPNVAITLREGARSLDPNFDDVAQVFRLTRWQRFSNVVWPQLEPYWAAAVRNGLALIWKIVLVVELLGRNNGVGFQINLFFGLFDLARILAYAISFMVIVWLIETIAVKPWERRARAWRGER
jgi:NitT/TauT family transport system permease protein